MPKICIRVTCARCGPDANLDAVLVPHFDGPPYVRVRCHGAEEIVQLPTSIARRQDDGMLVAFQDLVRLHGLVHDGCGGATSDGSCTCGRPGCHVQMRARGCPRYGGSDVEQKANE